MIAMANSTKFIAMNLSDCIACWDCVKACPVGVLHKSAVGEEKYASVVEPESCIGCYMCLDVCQLYVFSKVKS